MEIQVKLEELKQHKLFVATPMYGGMNHGLYMKSCLDLQTTMMRYGIEIKFSSAPKISQGLQICMDDLKLSKSYVITPDSAFFKLSESIDVCSLEYFLKEFLP
jgi:predicted AAA+ superfamily ATPase